MDLQLEYKDTLYRTRSDGDGKISILGQDSPPVSFLVVPMRNGYAIQSDDGLQTADAVRKGDTIWVRFRGRTYRLERSRGQKRGRSQTSGDLSSPMPGQVQKVLVKAGDTVKAQEPLLVVEAMKMQLEIKAPRDGVVKSVLAGEGDQVEAGSPLAELESTE